MSQYAKFKQHGQYGEPQIKGNYGGEDKCNKYGKYAVDTKYKKS